MLNAFCEFGPFLVAGSPAPGRERECVERIVSTWDSGWNLLLKAAASAAHFE